MPKNFGHYVDRFTGWFLNATGGRVNLHSLLIGGTVSTQMRDEDGVISVQNPLPINLLTITAKDIDTSGSDIGTFSGEVTDLIDDLDSYIEDNSATNPKWFEIKLKRPVENTSIKFCSPEGFTFSRVKIILKDRSGTTLVTVDKTSDSTAYSSNEYNWKLTPWCTIRIEFYTSSTVAISWAIIEQTIRTKSVRKFIDEGNSSSDTLDADEVFTGTWINTLDYAQALVGVTTDQDAASAGLRLELSDDGKNVRHAHTYDVLANTPDGHHYPSPLDLEYFRVKYTNGGTGQGSFSLHTTLMTGAVEDGHAHSMEYQIDASHPAPIRRTVLVAKKPNDEYVNIEATTAGNLKSAIEEYDDAVTPFRKDMEGGGKIAVGTTAVEVTFTGVTRSIIISADIANSGVLYVGKSNVTSAGANAVAFLQAGESVTIDYDDSSNAVYVVASIASQNFWKGALL